MINTVNRVLMLQILGKPNHKSSRFFVKSNTQLAQIKALQNVYITQK